MEVNDSQRAISRGLVTMGVNDRRWLVNSSEGVN